MINWYSILIDVPAIFMCDSQVLTKFGINMSKELSIFLKVLK